MEFKESSLLIKEVTVFMEIQIDLSEKTPFPKDPFFRPNDKDLSWGSELDWALLVSGLPSKKV